MWVIMPANWKIGVKRVNESISKLLNICLEYNKKEDFTVFFRFAGHVNLFEITRHKFGWDEGKGASLKLSKYFDKNIDAIPEFCEDAEQEIIALYKKSRKELEKIKNDKEYAKRVKKEKLIRELMELEK